MFDQNGDGVITSDEMVTAMRGLGHNPTRKEVAEMLGMDPKDCKCVRICTSYATSRKNQLK